MRSQKSPKEKLQKLTDEEFTQNALREIKALRERADSLDIEIGI